MSNDNRPHIVIHDDEPTAADIADTFDPCNIMGHSWAVLANGPAVCVVCGELP